MQSSKDKDVSNLIADKDDWEDVKTAIDKWRKDIVKWMFFFSVSYILIVITIFLISMNHFSGKIH